MRLKTLRRIRRIQEGLKLLWESDEARIRRKFRSEQGREPDLETPLTLNEKILWLNLHHRDPRRVMCSDKIAVREFVRDRIGDHYLVPLLGVFEDPEDIDLESLPDRFIVKATHGSGWNFIVRDKQSADWPAGKRRLRDWLSRSYFAHKREWQYRDIPPRLVIEELLLDADDRIPADYKAWCLGAGADPEILFQVDLDRLTDHTRNFYDSSWKRLPFGLRYPMNPRDVPRPDGLGEMVEVARSLARDFCFVRVDLYWCSGRAYFGELTFTPEGGTGRFDPPEWDRRLGDLIRLPASGSS